MTLGQEAAIKLKMYEGLNNNYPSVIQISLMPQSVIMAMQGQNVQSGNLQPVNQDLTVAAPALTEILILHVTSVEKKDIWWENVNIQVIPLLLIVNRPWLLTLNRHIVWDLHLFSNKPYTSRDNSSQMPITAEVL